MVVGALVYWGVGLWVVCTPLKIRTENVSRLLTEPEAAMQAADLKETHPESASLAAYVPDGDMAHDAGGLVVTKSCGVQPDS